MLHDAQMSLTVTKVLHGSHKSLMLPKWYMNFSCHECYHSAPGFSRVISVTKWLHDFHVSLMLSNRQVINRDKTLHDVIWFSRVINTTKVLHDSHMSLIVTKVLYDSHMPLIVNNVTFIWSWHVVNGTKWLYDFHMSLIVTQVLHDYHVPILRFSMSSSPTVKQLPRFHFQWGPTFTPFRNLNMCTIAHHSVPDPLYVSYTTTPFQILCM
jgi:hypothetical protein